MHKRYEGRRNDKLNKLKENIQSVLEKILSIVGNDTIIETVDDVSIYLAHDKIMSTSPAADSNEVDVFDWDTIPLSLHPEAGELNNERAVRKKFQISSLLQYAYLEIAYQLQHKTELVVVDIGAGSGHVGLVLAYLFPDIHVYLCERKDYSIQIALQRIQECNLTNVSINSDDISRLSELQFDVAVSLHSCGKLTDVALRLCHQNKASFVLVPCCYGQILKPPLDYITSTLEDYVVDHFNYNVSSLLFGSLSNQDIYKSIISAADFAITTFNEIDTSLSCSYDKNSSQLEYRLAKVSMRLLDLDRIIKICESDNRYYCTVSSLRPLSCSPKNNLIIGRFKQECHEK
jgi:hypothetical protein